MINVTIYRNQAGHIYGFEVKNHGKPIVCSAVSALTISVINSIEVFTDVEFVCDQADERKGGFLSFSIPAIAQGDFHHDADLLLKSCILSLESVKQEYPKDIHIIDKEVY